MEQHLIRRRTQNGTTILELLVSATTFLLVLSAILTFYTSGAKVTQQQDERMEAMRRSMRILDRLETAVAYSKVYGYAKLDGSSDESEALFFFRPDSENPVEQRGPNWTVNACKIILTKATTDGNRFLVYEDENQKRRRIADIYKDETLTMELAGNYLKVEMSLLYYPNKTEVKAEERAYYKMTRNIPIYNVDDII